MQCPLQVHHTLAEVVASIAQAAAALVKVVAFSCLPLVTTSRTTKKVTLQQDHAVETEAVHRRGEKAASCHGRTGQRGSEATAPALRSKARAVDEVVSYFRRYR